MRGDGETAERSLKGKGGEGRVVAKIANALKL